MSLNRAFFVTRSNRLDTSSADEHGEPTYLLDRAPSPYKTDECIEAIEAALDEAKYKPGQDLIAIAGPHILTSILVAVASWRGSTRILLWDAPGERYVERAITLQDRKTA